MLKALIFDFDGLILDTETPEAGVWIDIYKEHGFDFPFDEWVQIVGGAGLSNFNPADHIALLSQGRLDAVSMRLLHTERSLAQIRSQPVMPGVLELIKDAKALGMKVAIASSSSHNWVDGHAERLGIIHLFDKIICRDDVPPGRTKPNPDLYLLALEQLQVQKNEAVVFEDSPNGVKAANRAGIFVVAVPNPMTSRMVIKGQDQMVYSLSELALSELIHQVQ